MMSRRAARALTLLGTVLVLWGVDASIYRKERLIRTGDTIYLALAPVDPRSLMQGDYMALRFRLAESIEAWRVDDPSARRAPLTVDERGIASLDPGGGPEIAFEVRGDRVWLGTNAYFFQEGTGDRYANARFGEFRFDPSSGEAVLVGLRDEDLNPM